MSSSSPLTASYRQQLVDLYVKHDPDKVGSVDAILQRFAGHEEDLVQTVAREYAERSTKSEVPEHALQRGSSPDACRPQQPPQQEDNSTADSSLRASVELENVSRSPSRSVTVTRAPSTPNGATVSSKCDDFNSYHVRLTRLYEAHAPLRVSRVDHELAKYRGREEELIQAAAARFGPEPPVVMTTLAIPAAAAQETGKLSIGASGSPNSSLLSASPSGDVRSRAVELYLRYDPAKVHKVDAQLTKFKGHEEAYLRALERKLRGNASAAETKEEVVATAGDRATPPPSTVPVALQPTTNESEDSYTRRLKRIYETYAPERAHRAARQLQRYPGREEEVIQAAVIKYGPEPTTHRSNAETELYEHCESIASKATSNTSENAQSTAEIGRAHV